MLISRKHRFVFVHIYKTAGLSMTNALAPFAASELQLKANHFLKKIGVDYFEPEPIHMHSTAAEIAAHMGKKTFSRYFSFAIVRNPWDWQVSIYSYILKSEDHEQHALIKGFRDFKEYIRWRCAEEVRFQKDFVLDDQGEIMVNFIGRFERIAHDFKEICNRIGIDATLPRLNVSNELPYQSFYDDETRELVQHAFKPDIEMFDYRFEPIA